MISGERHDSIVEEFFEAQKDVKCCFDSMEILKREIPKIRKIVSDECWLHGERVNRPVAPCEVEAIVNAIVIRIGEKMREEAILELKSEKCIKNCKDCKWKPK